MPFVRRRPSRRPPKRLAREWNVVAGGAARRPARVVRGPGESRPARDPCHRLTATRRPRRPRPAADSARAGVCRWRRSSSRTPACGGRFGGAISPRPWRPCGRRGVAADARSCSRTRRSPSGGSRRACAGEAARRLALPHEVARGPHDARAARDRGAAGPRSPPDSDVRCARLGRACRPSPAPDARVRRCPTDRALTTTMLRTLRAQEELMLLLAGTRARRARTAGRMRKLCEQMSWDALLADLAHQGLVPLLGGRLLEAAWTPSRRHDFTRAVLDQTEASRRTGALMELATLRVATALEASGVPNVPLKGPLLARALHGDPGMRQSRDIDVLVERGKLELAAGALGPLGWRREDGPAADPILHVRLVHDDALPDIELHWRVHWYETRVRREGARAGATWSRRASAACASWTISPRSCSITPATGSPGCAIRAISQHGGTRRSQRPCAASWSRSSARTRA